MHDWTLINIGFDWRTARLTIDLLDPSSSKRRLIATGVREVRIPKEDEWGPSVSVYKVSETDSDLLQEKRLEVEMQSGDVIRIVAKAFDLQPP